VKSFTLLLFFLFFQLSTFAQKKSGRTDFEKALAKIENENYEGAIADLSKIIESDSLNAEAWFKRGFARAMLMDKEGALDDFNKAISLNSTDPEYFTERGIARKNAGDTDGACEDWNIAAGMDFAPAKELFNDYCK